jgi:hypothetical protein
VVSFTPRPIYPREKGFRYPLDRSRDSVLGIATGYGLEFKSGQSQEEFSLLRDVQTGSGVHQTFYPMGTGGKAAGPSR